MKTTLSVITMMLLLTGCASPKQAIQQLNAIEKKKENRSTKMLLICPDIYSLNPESERLPSSR